MRSNTWPAVRVEIAGRLVGEHALRLVTSAGRARRAGARRPTAPGQVTLAMIEPDASQHPFAAARASRSAPADRERHRDVLERGEFGSRVMELVDEAERAVAHRAALLLRQLAQIDAIHDTAPAVGASRPPRRCKSVLFPSPTHRRSRRARRARRRDRLRAAPELRAGRSRRSCRACGIRAPAAPLPPPHS
jgi:hypothetical protein